MTDKNFELIAARDIRVGDIGKTVIMTHGGQQLLGTLDTINVTVYHPYGDKPDQHWISLTVIEGTLKMEYKRIEPGYLVQIERTE